MALSPLSPFSGRICRRCSSLLARQHSSLFSTAIPTASKYDNFDSFTKDLVNGGILGDALSETTKTQQQSVREIQQQEQRRESRAARTTQQRSAGLLNFGNSPLSRRLEETRLTAVAGMQNRPPTMDIFGEMHHLHVYATKHNTIVTLTRPNRDPLLSLSTGNINFKKSQRGTFDAAYQLVTYAVTQIIEKGFLHEMRRLELIFRGYGPGREAFQKVILGTEGRMLKGMVRKVTDATRLKFGGCRSRQVRRL